MMTFSVGLGIAFTFGGLWLSYFVDLPSGATIILVSGVSFLVSLGIQKACKKAAGKAGKPA